VLEQGGTVMVNPTDELRAKLDELGVEYDTYDLPNGEHGLSWIDGNDIEWEVVQQGENFRIHALQLVTPEQAIAATVGAGTCELINAADDLGEGTSSCMCSKCGYTALDDWWDEFKCCPNCGARIEKGES
jgi:hypothetical protein